MCRLVGSISQAPADNNQVQVDNEQAPADNDQVQADNK
jgi:hypothetical protein